MKLRSAAKWLFGDSARSFGSLSAILLILLAAVPAQDYLRQWRGFQNRYLRLIRGRSEGLSLARRFQGGVQQIWLPEIGVVDRCTTCHVAEKEATLADVTVQPFVPHTPIPHQTVQFGCTPCHRGQGVATTVKAAHASTSAWEEPVLPAGYLGGSCGQCHWKPLPGVPFLNEGRMLIASYGCVRCHSVKMANGQPVTPTDDPPPLQHIAAKTNREWIYAWLKSPQAYSATATMPNFQLSDSDARDISAFLIAQSTPYTTERLPEPNESPAGEGASTVQLGSSVYGESFCASCHAMQNAAGTLVGGNVGPELTGVGTKVKPEWLEQWILNPRVYDPETVMPRYRFDTKQASLLLGFLQSKAQPDFVQNVHLEPATRAQIEHGGALVVERGCAICHDINGIKRPDNFAPDLTTVGSRPLEKIVFAPGVPITLPDYLAAKIRQPHSFGSSLKMPQYSFSPAQVNAVVTALLAQTDRAKSFPDSLRINAEPISHYRPAGPAGKLIDDMRCFSCHKINGRGGTMAPDLSWEGSSVQREWLVNFFKNPNTLRPALIRRMPKFNVTDSEANTLADYMMTAYQTPDFDRESIDPAQFSSEEAERGRGLYYEKYTCNSCHILDPKADKGYIGPTLTEVGTRLTAAWIFHWLKDAQSLRPGVLEPNWKMNDGDARDITAFLMKQGRRKNRHPGNE